MPLISLQSDYGQLRLLRKNSIFNRKLRKTVSTFIYGRDKGFLSVTSGNQISQISFKFIKEHNIKELRYKKQFPLNVHFLFSIQKYSRIISIIYPCIYSLLQMSKAQIYVDHVGKPEDPIRLEIIVLFCVQIKIYHFPILVGVSPIMVGSKKNLIMYL